jgi:hypothetical protein
VSITKEREVLEESERVLVADTDGEISLAGSGSDGSGTHHTVTAKRSQQWGKVVTL